jgi:hypothetical protein
MTNRLGATHLETLLDLEPALALAARSILGGSPETGRVAHGPDARLTQVA